MILYTRMVCLTCANLIRFTLVLFLFPLSVALASDSLLKVSKEIPGLTWNATPVSIDDSTPGHPIARFEGKGEDLKGRAIIYTLVDAKGSTQSLKVAIISPTDGTLMMLIPVENEIETVNLKLIDEYGKVLNGELVIRSTLTPPIKKSFRFDLALGPSLLNYTERSGPKNFDIHETVLTLKCGISYPLTEKLDLGLSAFATTFILGSTLSPTDAPTSRWLGLNARATYLIKDYSPNTRFYLSPGLYLWGMTPSSSASRVTYGISSLTGPQVVLSGRFKTDDGRNYGSYLKVALIANGFNFAPKNNEMAVGGNYQIGPIGMERRWTVGVDIARATFSESSNQEFTLLSYSLNIGVAF